MPKISRFLGIITGVQHRAPHFHAYYRTRWRCSDLIRSSCLQARSHDGKSVSLRHGLNYIRKNYLRTGNSCSAAKHRSPSNLWCEP